jgi:hypothetical protein
MPSDLNRFGRVQSSVTRRAGLASVRVHSVSHRLSPRTLGQLAQNPIQSQCAAQAAVPANLRCYLQSSCGRHCLHVPVVARGTVRGTEFSAARSSAIPSIAFNLQIYSQYFMRTTRLSDPAKIKVRSSPAPLLSSLTAAQQVRGS